MSIHEVITDGDCDELIKALNEGGDYHERNKSGATPLHLP